MRPKDLVPDPLLTGYAVVYGTGGAFIHDQVMPTFSSKTETFKFATYKAAELDNDFESIVAPGDKPNKTTDRLPTFTTLAIPRRALDQELPQQVIATNTPYVRQANRVRRLTHRLKLSMEKRVKVLLDAAGTSTSPSVKWDASSGTIIIEKNVDDAKEAFEKACGYAATHLILPRAVANVVKRDPSIRALRKTQNDGLLTDGGLPDTVFGLRVIVPGALHNTANPGVAQSIDRVWADDTAYLVYVDPAFGQDGESMTSIGAANWAEFGTPYAAFSWSDAHVSKRTEWISVEASVKEHLVCSDAVYRLTDVLT